MSIQNFKVVLFSPPENLPLEHENLCQIFEEGLKVFHLRKPTYSLSQMKDYLEKIPKEFHDRIVLHSNYELTDSFFLKGVHLTEQKRRLVATSDNKKIISTSFHNLEDYQKEQKNFQYVFLSPIFDSISKQNYKSPFCLETLKNSITTYKRVTTIALGGIALDNIEEVKKLGFDGIATIGSVWLSENPLSSFIKIQSLTQTYSYKQ